MSDDAQALTLDRVRGIRQRLHAHIAQETRELGADPALIAGEAGRMNGLEFLQRWLNPEMPPPPAVAVLFGMEWVEIEPSRVALALEPAEWMFNPIGMIHGGVAATLLDTVMGSAVHTTLPAGTGYTTSDLQIRYLRAMNLETGRVIATGNVVHPGRRHATAEGRIEVEETGKLIATATAGCTIIGPA